MDTIRSSKEISLLFKKGKRSSNRYVTFLFLTKPTSHSNSHEHDLDGRVAFVAGKKNGNAVWRNSAKRRMREICRALGGPWKNYDVIFIAKPPLTDESYSKVLKECEKTLFMDVMDNKEASR